MGDARWVKFPPDRVHGLKTVCLDNEIVGFEGLVLPLVACCLPEARSTGVLATLPRGRCHAGVSQ